MFHHMVFYFCSTMKIYRVYLLLPLLLLFVWGCDEEDVVISPKPKGYPRLHFPEKKYHTYTPACPYTFEISDLSSIKVKNDSCWCDIVYPAYKASIHLSYKPVRNNNISQYIEDSRDFAIRHQIKATGLNESIIIRDTAKVYGLLYDISGNTASSVQFYLTDSTRHFLRGALYFNVAPNIDSLQVVIDYIRKDIIHLIKTTQWK